MRHLVVLYALFAAACDPDVCGTVEIAGVVTDPEIESFRNAAGNLELAELCGTSYGAFAQDRPDYMFTTLVLSANVPDADVADDVAVTQIVLPAGSVVFLNSHLVAGTTIGMSQLAGSGLHKQSADAIYQVYPLTAGTVTILAGSNKHTTAGVDEQWSEEWRMKWDLEFGGGIEHWTGEDTVERHDGNDIGTPVYLPPDYRAP